MKNDQQYSVASKNYDEQQTLQQLLAELNAAASSPTAISSQFSITINGRQFEFIVGGAQTNALYSFIQSLADDEGYQL